MARRNQHTQEEIKEMVLQAAETIVREEGLAALKVREIAMEIGYTVGSIYMVFENMADLVRQLQIRGLEKLNAQLAQVPFHPAPQQQLLKLAQTYLQFAWQNLHLWQMLFALPSLAQANGQDCPPHKLILQRLETLLQQLNPAAAPPQLHSAARALWFGVHGVCLLSLAEEMPQQQFKETEQAVQLLVKNFLNGWLQSKP